MGMGCLSLRVCLSFMSAFIHSDSCWLAGGVLNLLVSAVIRSADLLACTNRNGISIAVNHNSGLIYGACVRVLLASRFTCILLNQIPNLRNN